MAYRSTKFGVWDCGVFVQRFGLVEEALRNGTLEGAEREAWQQYYDACGAFPPPDAGSGEASIELLSRPALGGDGVDVLDATWTTDIHAGYQQATLTVVPPRGVSKFDDSVLAGVTVPDLDHHTLFEGRVEEPSVDFMEANSRELACGGYSGYLADIDSFRRCYVSGDPGAWAFDQATPYASLFSSGIEDGDRIVVRVAAGADASSPTHLPLRANARAYWQLFDGDATSETIRGFKADYVVDSFDEGLGATLHGRDKLTGGSIDRVLWTAPSVFHTTGTISLDADDIGNDITCLVLILRQGDGAISDYADTGGEDPDVWSVYAGVGLSEPRVYGSELGFDVSPEAVVKDIVLTVVDEDHTDFPDSSGVVLGDLYIKDRITQGQAIEQVNAALDWNYGFGEGHVFHYRKPWTKDTVPRTELVCVSMADPRMGDWSVRLDYTSCCNRVVAEYQTTLGVRSVTVQDGEGPLGTSWRSKTLDLTGSVSDHDTAVTLATKYLQDNLWPKPTGSLTLRDKAHLACGIDLPALQVLPGMMVYNMDVPEEDGGGCLLITSIDGSLVAREVTINVGVRSNRLDRWMAAKELKVRARKRRRR